MKKFFLLIVLTVSIALSASAQSITVTSQFNGTTPPGCTDFKFARGTMPASATPIGGALGAGSCDDSNCSFYNFARPWESVTIKNTNASSAVCYDIDYDGTTTTNLVGWTQAGAFSNVAGPCPPRFDDNGSYFLHQPTVNNWLITIPACSEATVVTWAFGNAGPYTFTIRPRSGSTRDAVACTDAKCINYLTIGGTPVPTMTQWGLFLFGLVLLTLAVVSVYNLSTRRSASNS